MRDRARRVSALEQFFDPPGFQPWHVVIVDDGQTEAQALAAYEAEHGPIGDASAFVVDFVKTGVSRHGPPGSNLEAC